MKESRLTAKVTTVLFFALSLPNAHVAHGAPTNHPPVVSIVWPQYWDVFTSEFFKIKAMAFDPDGSVAQVRFFAGTNLIGVVTNPPFNILWQLPQVCEYRTIDLEAVAV